MDFDGSFETETGPSWQRSGWPLTDTDALTAGMDPTQMQVAVKAAAAKGGVVLSEAELVAATARSVDQLRADADSRSEVATKLERALREVFPRERGPSEER